MQGSRSGLWLTIAKGVRVLRPKLIVLENVNAIRSRGLDRVLGDLAALGYDARWTSLRASDVGAAHRRERVFILAYNAEGKSLLDALAHTKHGRHEKCPAGRDAQGTSSPSKAWGCVSNCPPPRKNEVVANTACTGRIRGETQTNEKGASTQRPGGVAELYSSYDWGEYEPAVRRWEAVVGRVAPSPIEKGTKGQPRLAARFVEWLMGLPVGYVTGIGLPRSGELKALGNGVVPQQAEEALRALLQSAIDDEPISA